MAVDKTVEWQINREGDAAAEATAPHRHGRYLRVGDNHQVWAGALATPVPI
jgi:hypothetical protein